MEVISFRKLLLLSLFFGMYCGLSAQTAEENVYYVKLNKISAQRGTSHFMCGDDYHFLYWTYTTSKVDNEISRSLYGVWLGVWPTSFFKEDDSFTLKNESPMIVRLHGRAGDEPDDYVTNVSGIHYNKGSTPQCLSVYALYTHGCNRYISACYELTVDDPVFITNASSTRQPNNRLSTDSDELRLAIGAFYRNGKDATLQVSADNGVSWTNIQNVYPQNTVSLNYDYIIKVLGKKFEDLLSKSLSFRVIKTLLNGTVTYGNILNDIKFYPDGMRFTVQSSKRSYCNDIELRAKIDMSNNSNFSKNVRYMHLSPDRFRWVVASDSNMSMAFNCRMIPTEKLDEFIISPDFNFTSDADWDSIFPDVEDRTWFIQLRDTTEKECFAAVRPFTVPAKPAKITVSQKSPMFDINGTMYHLPHSRDVYAMLDIDDPYHEVYSRLPFTLLEDGEPIATITNLGTSSYEELSEADKEKYDRLFDEYYNENINGNLAASLARYTKKWYAEHPPLQFDLPTPAKYIALSPDGSYFLYNNGGDIYRAFFQDNTVISTEQITTGDYAGYMEIVPDGSACVYKRYSEEGLFTVPLTGSFPATGTLLSPFAKDAEWDEIIYENAGVHHPRMIFLNEKNSYEAVSEYPQNEKVILYRISLEDGTYRVIDTASLPQFFPNSRIYYATAYPCLSSNGILAYMYNTEASCTNAGCHLLDSIKICNLALNQCETIDLIYTKGRYEPGFFLMYNGFTRILDIDSSGTVLLYHYFYNYQYTHLLKSAGGEYYEIPIYEEIEQVANVDGRSFFVKYIPEHNAGTPPDFIYGITNGLHGTYRRGMVSLNNFISNNICFSPQADYYLFTSENAVYRQGGLNMNPIFRPYYKEFWLAKMLSVKVSDGIKLNTRQSLALRDSDGCVYDPFEVHVTAPASPLLSYRIIHRPTSPCSRDGVAVIKYLGGGIPDYVHMSGTLHNYNDSITVNTLSFGDNKVDFNDSFGNESYSFTLFMDGGAQITGVTTSVQTCSIPDGKIKISTAGMSGSKTFVIQMIDYPFSVHTYTTVSDVHEFTGISSGAYRVKVKHGSCELVMPDYAKVDLRIFDISSISVSPSPSLSGTGSATVTFANLSGGASWTFGSELFNNQTFYQSPVKTRDGGIYPGTYSITATSSNGCSVTAGFNVDKPNYSGVVKINYSSDSCLVYVDHLSGNSLFQSYAIKITDSHNKKIPVVPDFGAVVKESGTYDLYLYSEENMDSLLVHSFLFPVRGIDAGIQIIEPDCPYSAGAVDITVTGGCFDYGDTGEVAVSIDGINYSGASRYNVESGHFTCYLKDSQTNYYDGITVLSTYIEELYLTMPEGKPVSANVSYNSPLCAGSGDAWIRLSDFTGNSGDYRYRINDNPWRDTAYVSNRLSPGLYMIYVKDNGNNCEERLLNQIVITEPDSVNIHFSDVRHPLCSNADGFLSAIASGGDGHYSYCWRFNGSFLDTLGSVTDAEVNLGDNLRPGFYTLTVYDANQCSASDTVTLQEYHRPQIIAVSSEDASCSGASDGSIDVTGIIGSTAADTVYLLKDGLPYSHSGIPPNYHFADLPHGYYSLTVKDLSGCLSDIAYHVAIDEPEHLFINIVSLVPVASKGSQSGIIRFRISGGNSGNKRILLYNSNGTAVDSLENTGAGILQFTQYSGTYNIMVTDIHGCTFVTPDLYIEEPSESLGLTVIEVRDAMCKSQTGSISVRGIGGWGDYKYKRGNEQNFSSLNIFDKLYPGNYLITVQDKMGVTFTTNITVHEPKDSLNATIFDKWLPTCGNNGGFMISVSGGTPPYKLLDGIDTLYCLNPQSVTMSNKTSGKYSIMLTDANGCRFEAETILSDEKLMEIDLLAVRYPDITSSSDGFIAAVVRGGNHPYSYHWTLNSELTLPCVDSLLVSAEHGYYRVTVTDAAGCFAEKSLYLHDIGSHMLSLERTGHETSFGNDDGYAVFSGVESFTSYSVITPDATILRYNKTDIAATFSILGDTLFMHGLYGGKWILTAETLDGHTSWIEFIINKYEKFDIDKVTSWNVRRKGGSDGKIRVDVTGGGGSNSYKWRLHTVSGWCDFDYLPINAENATILSGVSSGLYEVEIIDCYGNNLRRQIHVFEPEEDLKLIVLDYQNQSCNTYRDAWVITKAANGWGDYQYRSHTENHFGHSAVFNDLHTGVHTFYAIDREGSIDSVSIIITEPDQLVPSVTSTVDVTCKDFSDARIFFNTDGGTGKYRITDTVSWINYEGNMASDLQAGWHTFVFTDSNSCPCNDTLSVYIQEPDLLLITDINVEHTTCGENNGKINVDVQGGIQPYTYMWTDGNNAPAGTSNQINGLKQNELYNLSVTDINGCNSSIQQRILPSYNPAVNGIQTTGALCYGESTGTAVITQITPAEPYAPYQIFWSNGDTGSFSGNFTYGTHYVTVTDTNGCTSDSQYFYINHPDSLHITIIQIKEPSCFGFSDGQITVEAVGGTPGYEYLWNNGSDSNVAGNLHEGVYTVSITDSNGCHIEESFNVNQPDYLNMELGDDVTMCPGNTHVIDAGIYSSYRWFDADVAISNERFLRVTEPGQYCLDATDAVGCISHGCINVDVGNDALNAYFLMASQAWLGDTVILFELSNMPLDSLKWQYNYEAFSPVTTHNEEQSSYTLSLLSKNTGIYSIELYAFAGGCSSRAVKIIEILDKNNNLDSDPDIWGYKNPVITMANIYPNPNNGSFNVQVELKDTADIRLVLFEVSSGSCINSKYETGNKQYIIEYQMQQLRTGLYFIIIYHNNERKQINMLVTK